MKTITKIAEELGVTRQRVYRYIKNNHIKAIHQKQRVMYYDELSEMRIRQHFLAMGSSVVINHDECPKVASDELNSILKDDIIREQQKIIRELTAAVKIQANNANHKSKKKDYIKRKLSPTKPTSVAIQRLLARQKINL